MKGLIHLKPAIGSGFPSRRFPPGLAGPMADAIEASHAARTQLSNLILSCLCKSIVQSELKRMVNGTKIKKSQEMQDRKVKVESVRKEHDS